MIQTQVEPKLNGSALIIRPALEFCQDAATRPTPPMLAGPLFYENEICFLFAETGAGKSLLAVQIGTALSEGKSIGPLRNEARPMKVVYMDFELSDKQFQLRYTSGNDKIYQFSENFLRAELSSDNGPADGVTWEDYILAAFEETILKFSPQILIIDNLTYLETDTEKAKKAAPLMKKLKELKKKYNITLLVIAHTPKRNPANPITRNDLAGSKMLMNFCDSAFVIGESAKDTGLRYIKQIKTRYAEKMYDGNQVLTGHITDVDGLTGFEFMGTTNEKEHLKELNKNELSDLDNKVIDMLKAGTTYRDIASRLQISVGKVQYIKKRFEDENAPF